MITIYSYGADYPIDGASIVRAAEEMSHELHNAKVRAWRLADDLERRAVRAACPPAIVATAERAEWWVRQWIALARIMRSDGRAPKHGTSPLAARIEHAQERERTANRNGAKESNSQGTARRDPRRSRRGRQGVARNLRDARHVGHARARGPRCR